MGSNPTPSAMSAQAGEIPDPMALALDEARAALAHDDVPVGAVVVHGGVVIAARHNERELRNDPVAHAEILALRDAARHLGQWRLDECEMYVSTPRSRSAAPSSSARRRLSTNTSRFSP